MTLIRSLIRNVALPALLAILAAAGTTAAAERFYPVDVVVDAGASPLAAWQLELIYDREAVTLVGIEAGEAPFSEAPYYDPRGLAAGRIILASFTLADAPPAGPVRIARLHLMERKQVSRPLEARLIVAADPQGGRTPAAVILIPSEGERP